MSIEGKDFFVICSIGIAVFPHDGAGAEALLMAAEMAMCRAKEKGRNNYQFFEPSLNAGQKRGCASKGRCATRLRAMNSCCTTSRKLI